MSKRKVKCRYCEQFTTQGEAYKVVKKGKNEYYCNEEHYQNLIKRKNDRKDILRMCSEILEYNVTQDTYFLKSLKEVLETTKTENLRDYLKDNMIDLDMALAKDFKTLVFKVKYFFAIVKRGLIEYEEIKKIEEKNNKFKPNAIEQYNYKFKPRKRKVTWVDIIDGRK